MDRNGARERTHEDLSSTLAFEKHVGLGAHFFDRVWVLNCALQ